MSDASSQFGNCSNFTKDELATVTLTFGVNGGVCCFLACLLTLLLLINKSYHTVLQRLLLYLLVTTILNELFITASAEHYFEYSVQEKVCTWIGFLSTWAILLRRIFTAGIMIYLCFRVLFLTKESKVTRFFAVKMLSSVIRNCVLDPFPHIYTGICTGAILHQQIWIVWGLVLDTSTGCKV